MVRCLRSCYCCRAVCRFPFSVHEQLAFPVLDGIEKRMCVLHTAMTTLTPWYKPGPPHGLRQSLVAGIPLQRQLAHWRQKLAQSRCLSACLGWNRNMTPKAPRDTRGQGASPTHLESFKSSSAGMSPRVHTCRSLLEQPCAFSVHAACLHLRCMSPFCELVFQRRSQDPALKA